MTVSSYVEEAVGTSCEAAAGEDDDEEKMAHADGQL
jgi:hypothetical protein